MWEPTRVTVNSFSIIDHIATNCANNIIKSEVHKISLSDHFIVYCVRKPNGTIEKSHKLIKTRKMKGFNELVFLSEVASIGWDQMVTETDDINALVTNLTHIFSLIIDKHAPVVEKCVSDKYCPCIIKYLEDFLRTRDKLKKSAVKSKSALVVESYRQVCNRVNALNKQLKKEYFTNMILSCKGNIKDSWRTINELLNKRSKSSNIDSLKGSDSKTVCKKDVYGEMNSYFSSIGKELADKISI